jgi:hypothetical protein
MSDETRDKSHAGAWITGVVVALLFYVLSTGPMLGLAANGTLPDSTWPIINAVYEPLKIFRGTALGEPLGAYVDWWVKLLKKP